MKYSLTTAALFAVTLATKLVSAIPLIKARDANDEIAVDAPRWFYDIRNISIFIENASTYNASYLQNQSISALSYWSDEHARETHLNTDLPELGIPFNSTADTEFNGAWQGVKDAFQRMRDGGGNGLTASHDDIAAALNGLCRGSWSGARELLRAAGVHLNTTFRVDKPSICGSFPLSAAVAASTSTTMAQPSTTQAASSTSSAAAATTTGLPPLQCKI